MKAAKTRTKKKKYLKICGALTRTRTANLLITNQLLYQLSYEGLRIIYHEKLINPILFTLQHKLLLFAESY